MIYNRKKNEPNPDRTTMLYLTAINTLYKFKIIKSGERRRRRQRSENIERSTTDGKKKINN